MNSPTYLKTELFHLMYAVKFSKPAQKTFTIKRAIKTLMIKSVSHMLLQVLVIDVREENFKFSSEIPGERVVASTKTFLELNMMVMEVSG